MSEKPSYEEIIKRNIALEIQNKELKQYKTAFQSANNGMALTDMEEKQREEILTRHEYFFSITDDLIAYIDKNYIYQFISKRCSRDHKKNRSEIVGHSVAELLGEKCFLQTIKPKLDRCLTGETVNFQEWLEFASIGRRYRETTYYPYRLSNGRIDGIIAVIHDLTELKLAEEKHALEQERFNSVLQAIPDGVYIVNRHYTIEYINPVIEREFGPVNERKCFEYLYGRTDPCQHCKNEKVFAGESIHREWHSNKNERDYEIFDSPLKGTDGASAKVSFFHDVTQEKKVKETLEKNQMLLDGIINNSSAVIYVKDKHGKFLMVNTRFHELFNTNGEAIIGGTDFDLFPEKQARKFQSHDQEVLATGLVSQSEEIVQQQDGNHVYVSIKFPLFNAKDSVFGVAGISTDITDYKQLEIELQENNKRLTALINASPDIIYFKDGEGRWLLANEAGLRKFQLINVDYKGKTDAQLACYNTFYQDALLTCMETDKEAWKKEKLSRGDETIPTPDEEDRVFDIVKVPLFHADGTRLGLVIQGHDITKHLKMEKSLRQRIVAHRLAAEVVQEKSEELEEANIALRVLLKQQKNIAEEVQQSVLAQLEKAVLPYIALLRQSLQDDKGKEYLDILSKHVHEVGTPFIKKLSNPDLKLTKREILVADLVRQGKSTKEIAKLLHLQAPSVETYRNKIRKKLHLNNKKITLYQYLTATFSFEK